MKATARFPGDEFTPAALEKLAQDLVGMQVTACGEVVGTVTGAKVIDGVVWYDMELEGSHDMVVIDLDQMP